MNFSPYLLAGLTLGLVTTCCFGETSPTDDQIKSNPSSPNPNTSRKDSETITGNDLSINTKKPIVYVEPFMGAPRKINRISMGTRSQSLSTAYLAVVAPQGVGITNKPDPTLYWYISKPIDYPLEFVIAPKYSEKLHRQHLAPIKKAGLQSISLADLGITLDPKVQYDWSVAAIVDSERHSRDQVALGQLMLVPPDDRLKNHLATLVPTQLPYELARKGVWYDAIESLVSIILKNCDDQTMLDEFDRLMNQVNLSDIVICHSGLSLSNTPDS